jgi:uncharacterized membrane protein YhaH (DUF805 family)
MEPTNPYQPPTTDVSAPATGDRDQSSPFSPSGRFGRLSYIAWGLIVGVLAQVINTLAGLGGVGVDWTTDISQASAAGLAVVFAVGLVSLIAFFIFAIRRLHDFDASGWWSLALIVPLANLVLLLILWLKRGTEGPNRFAPPRPTPGWEKVVGYIGIAFIVLGLVLGIAAIVAMPVLMSQLGPQS